MQTLRLTRAASGPWGFAEAGAVIVVDPSLAARLIADGMAEPAAAAAAGGDQNQAPPTTPA